MSHIKNLQWDNREEGDTPLRQMQLVELRLLRILDSICKKHKLTYCLIGGTLLGAVRHKGFIPWDDDIDVMMPVEDAERFYKIAAQELPNDVVALYQTKKFARSHFPCLKLFDAYSSAYTKVDDARTSRHLGISLDIFTLLPYADDSGVCYRILYQLMSFARRMRSRFMHTILIVPANIAVNLLDGLFRLVNNRKKIYWGHGPWTCGYGSTWRTRNEDMFPCRPILFEGFVFMGPNNPDAYLRHYGDYMKLPPEEQRKPHEEIILPFTKCNHPRAMEWPKKR